MPGATRVGDKFSCGDFVAEGSNNVFVNNKPLSRIGDATTGHPCSPTTMYPPSIIEAPGSNNVLTNYKKTSKKGDKNKKHCCGKDCHQGTLVSVSENVFIN